MLAIYKPCLIRNNLAASHACCGLQKAGQLLTSLWSDHTWLEHDTCPLSCRPKIVEGRLNKIRSQKALLEQPFIKDTGSSVAEHIKTAVASLGENIQVGHSSRCLCCQTPLMCLLVKLGNHCS